MGVDFTQDAYKENGETTGGRGDGAFPTHPTTSLGRFSSADTIIPGAGNPQSWDRFAYVNNSPLMYTDPSGHRACDGDNCTGSQNPVAEYATETIAIKMVKLNRLRELSLIPMVNQFPCDYTNFTYNPTAWYLPSSTSPTFQASPLAPKDELHFYWDMFQQVQTFEEADIYIRGFGRPFYRHLKGALSINPIVEGGIGAGLQYIYDSNNTQYSFEAKISRSFTVGVEDIITDQVSTYVGTVFGTAGFLAGAGGTFETGPGALFVGSTIGLFSYMGGSYLSTRLMDQVFDKINPIVLPFLF